MNGDDDTLLEEYKYKHQIQLGNYVFSGENNLTVFLKDVLKFILKNINYQEIQLINDFGTVKLSNIDQLEDEINCSKSIYRVKYEVGNKDGQIQINIRFFENIRNKSSIYLFSNNKKWIQDVETDLIKIMPAKNRLRFMLHPLFKIPVWIFFSNIILLAAYNESFQQYFSKSKNFSDTMILVILYSVVYIFVEFSVNVFVPAFVIKKKYGLIHRIKRAFTKPENMDNILISIIITLCGIILSMIISKI